MAVFGNSKKYTGPNRIQKALDLMKEKRKEGFKNVSFKDNPESRNRKGLVKVKWGKKVKNTNEQ